MTNTFILKKNKIKGFLRAIMKDFRLISPQLAKNGDFLFQETQDLDRISFDYDVTSNTLKDFFFSRREIIFEYLKTKGNSIKIIPAQDEIKQEAVFLGVRSCDVRAVYFQDTFFSQEPKDALYWRKRNKSVLISLACNKQPRQSCFCGAMEGGPFLDKNEGFDLQLIDLQEEYLVEIGTEKGGGLINDYPRFFSLAETKHLIRKGALLKKCLKGFGSKYNRLDIHTKLKNLNLNKLWEELGKRCTNCAGCEFICPTCFCFYTQDIESTKNKGQRIRSWDSCTFSGYSRMSGNINPYEKNSERISRRFFCKLYNCFRWFRLFACTGCGRCAFVCPVNLDMESFIKSLSQGSAYKPLLKEL